MAVFNPQVPDVQDPNYLSYSKGIEQPEANKTAATAIAGIGNVFDVAVKGTDFLIKEDIKNQAEAKVRPIQDKYIFDLQAAKQGLGGERGGVVNVDLTYPDFDASAGANPMDAYAQASPEDAAAAGSAAVPKNDQNPLHILPQTSNDPVPTPIDAGIARAANVQSAFDNGKISHTQYRTNLDNVATSLRTRYPGYSEYIDAQMARLTGSRTTANQLITSLAQDVNRLYAQSSKDDSKAMQMLMKSADDFRAPAMLRYYQRTGDINAVFTWHSEVEFDKAQLQLEAQRRANRKGTVDEKADEDARMANNQAFKIVANSFDALSLGGGKWSPRQMQDKLINAATSGKALDPGEVKQYGEALSALELQLPGKIQAELRKQGYSYKPEVENEIIKQAMLPITQARKLISADLYTAAGAVERAVKVASDRATNVIFGHRELAAYLSVMDALSANRNPAAVQQIMTATANALPNSMTGAREVMDYFKMQSIMGPNFLMGEVPKANFSDAISQSQKYGFKEPEMYNEFVNHIRSVTDKTNDMTDDHRIGVLNWYFDAKNQKALEKFEKDYRDESGRMIPGRVSVYSRLFSKEVSAEVERLSGLYPAEGIREKYVQAMDRNWALIFRDTMTDFTALRNTKGLQVSYDPKVAEWNVRVVGGNPDGSPLTAGQRRSMAINKSANAPIPYNERIIDQSTFQQAKDLVNKVNVATRSLKGFAEVVGQDINQVVMGQMIRWNFDPNAGAASPLDFMGQAVFEAVKQQTPSTPSGSTNKRTSEPPKANTTPSTSGPAWQDIPHFAEPERPRQSAEQFMRNPEETIGYVVEPTEIKDKMGRTIRTEGKPTYYDYFKAGAKDFVEDVKGTISGTSRGPSMKNRQELLDRDK